MTDGQVSTNDDEKIIFNKECLIHMVKSLYSGVSGLTVHQTRMDVIGNNIANVNSDGFKASRVTFRDIYYQGYINASSGRATYAGNNPSQVGYGVQVGSIDKDMSQSGGKSSKSAFDMMLEGDGFFMTMTFDNLNITSDKSPAVTRYTRLGKFQVDSYGNVVATNNVFVVGSRNTLDGLTQTGGHSLNAMNDVQYIDRNDDGRITATDITYRNVINLDELMQEAWNVYTDQAGYTYGYDWEGILIGKEADDEVGSPAMTAYAGVVFDIKKARADGYTVAEGKLQKNGTAVTDLDTIKKYVDVQETVKKLNSSVDANGAAQAEPGIAYRYYVDLTGTPIKNAELKYPNYQETYAAFFDNNVLRNRTSAEFIAAQTTAGARGAVIGELKYDIADGLKISPDGIITVTYAGSTKSLARIDLAVFENPEGLDEDGMTQFAESAASGEAKLRRAGIDPGVTTTSVVSQRVEMSNVNLADEFSDMIVTQRGFQANARIITTSDSMLEELVNLKR